MAYGWYDNAAELLLKALRRDPDQVDLKVKLLEIYFVAGKSGDFLAAATQHRDDIKSKGDWQRIANLGRQLCPDEPLFLS